MVPKAARQLIIQQLNQHNHRHIIFAGVSLGILSLLLLLVTGNANAIREDNLPAQFEVDLSLPEGQVTLSPLASQARWEEHVIQLGDTLTSLLGRSGIGQKTALTVSKIKHGHKLRVLVPGKTIRIQASDESEPRLLGLDYPLNSEKSLSLRLDDDENYFALIHKPQYEHRIRFSAGVVENSLYEAALSANLSDNLTMQLAEIFGWDIDFALDIRQGDSFSLLYDEQYLHGAKVGDGVILAAEFSNRGKTYSAVRFVDKSGRAHYYDPQGRSLRKAFLRTPVDFRRISSRFGKRFHPVHKKVKRHMGVDYSAKPGTPIRATGDGKIVLRGRKGGYGKTIIIRHGNVYSTLYAHMRSYARGMRPGKYIRQGQVIGYVGQTGTATGPHLHYEFRFNGVHRNPLTVRLPDAQPIAHRYRKAFQQLLDSRNNQLALFKARHLAMLDAQ
ncbi:MAG: peptidoglycan DD-metalloendopeptidase family protein [Gammaproteobacteria bacterium]|nr:peptidoglycan DD-metalloendopeptidase family protein [Gammaproteobacteria bacterium]